MYLCSNKKKYNNCKIKKYFCLLKGKLLLREECVIKLFYINSFSHKNPFKIVYFLFYICYPFVISIHKNQI